MTTREDRFRSHLAEGTRLIDSILSTGNLGILQRVHGEILQTVCESFGEDEKPARNSLINILYFQSNILGSLLKGLETLSPPDLERLLLAASTANLQVGTDVLEVYDQVFGSHEASDENP